MIKTLLLLAALVASVLATALPCPPLVTRGAQNFGQSAVVTVTLTLNPDTGAASSTNAALDTLFQNAYSPETKTFHLGSLDIQAGGSIRGALGAASPLKIEVAGGATVTGQINVAGNVGKPGLCNTKFNTNNNNGQGFGGPGGNAGGRGGVFGKDGETGGGPAGGTGGQRSSTGTTAAGQQDPGGGGGGGHVTAGANGQGGARAGIGGRAYNQHSRAVGGSGGGGGGGDVDNTVQTYDTTDDSLFGDEHPTNRYPGQDDNGAGGGGGGGVLILSADTITIPNGAIRILANGANGGTANQCRGGGARHAGGGGGGSGGTVILYARQYTGTVDTTTININGGNGGTGRSNGGNGGRGVLEVVTADASPTINVVEVREFDTVRLNAYSAGIWACGNRFVWDLDGDGTFGETGINAENGDEVGVNVVFETRLRSNPQLSLQTQPINVQVRSDPRKTTPAQTYSLGIQVTPRRFRGTLGPYFTDVASTPLGNMLVEVPPV